MVRDDAGAERWLREFRRGSTRLAVLQILSRGESYGYEILSSLAAAGSLEATEATVYPILHSLEDEGSVTTSWRKTTEGVPPRKYYKLNAAGRKQLESLAATWRTFRDDLDELLEG